MGKLVYGFGINDVDYVVCPTVNGKRVWCPFYQNWHNMIERCYSDKYQVTHATYVDFEVCLEWKYFTSFRSWMITQDWEGKHLDKDLLSNIDLYSPTTCCFVEQWLNNLFTGSSAKRGKYTTGVYWHKRNKKFQAQLNVNGQRRRLGCFATEQEAHRVYLKAKQTYVIEKMKDYPAQGLRKRLSPR